MESTGGAICTDSIIIYKDRGCPNSSSQYITDGCWPLKASVQQKAGGCGDREVRGAGVGKKPSQQVIAMESCRSKRVRKLPGVTLPLGQEVLRRWLCGRDEYQQRPSGGRKLFQA